LTQIIIDTFKGMYNAAFLKTLVMIIMSLVLNILCSRNFTIIAWLIVFIPFILMTYITSILFFVFGLDPKNSDNLNYNVVYPTSKKRNVVIVDNNGDNNNDDDNNNDNDDDNKDGTTADDYDPDDYTSGTPSDINNYN
jgi:hypothetical protein